MPLVENLTKNGKAKKQELGELEFYSFKYYVNMANL